MPFWSSEYTRAVRRMSAGLTSSADDEFAELDSACRHVHDIKRNAWSLSRRPSKVWGEHLPMNVCIIGAGAAGYFLTDALLQSSVPACVVFLCFLLTLFDPPHRTAVKR